MNVTAPKFIYLYKSDRNCEGMELACDSTEMPDCRSICVLVRFAVSSATSTSRMLEIAAE